MFVGIANEPRPYAWGSATAIADLLGRVPSGGPEAELWLGAHPGSPSRITDPAQVGGACDLEAWIAAEPQAALGASPGGGRLPFLLKILAAERPLSLQAHPSAEQARAGYLREDEANVPLGAPHRNYKDPYSKPEMIYALSERFEALCGFRPVEETLDLVRALMDLDFRGDTSQPALLYDLIDRLDSLPNTVEWLISGGPQVAALVDRVSTIVRTTEFSTRDSFPQLSGATRLPGAVGFDGEIATARALAEEYPGDPGIVISLLLNRVTLARGEALYLPAGNIHAYLGGLGVELMGASDNVLRGGLTTKHVDAAELLGVLDFTPGPVPYLRPSSPVEGVEVFRPEAVAGTGPSDDPGFVLVRVEAAPGRAARRMIAGPAIAICTDGAVSIEGRTASVALERGQSVYVTPDETELVVTGLGTVFVATVS